jgi:TM2 domain-containing membrane protein YozV
MFSGSIRPYQYHWDLTANAGNQVTGHSANRLPLRSSIEQTQKPRRIFARRVILMRDPFTAGLLSFLIPGIGQLYNGRILAGILWLIITPGFWIGTGGTLGWICHIIAAYTAYSYAKDYPVRT